MTGIHAGEERFDQPVHHGVAEALGDEGTDRHVAGQRWPEALGAGARRLVRRQDADRRRRVGRHAHQCAGREGMEGAPAPDRRGHWAGVHDVGREPHLGEEVEGFRATGQHRLGADVDELAGDLSRAQLASGAVGGLQDDYVDVVVLQQLPRGGQSGDARADDDHRGLAHRPSVS